MYVLLSPLKVHNLKIFSLLSLRTKETRKYPHLCPSHDISPVDQLIVNNNYFSFDYHFNFIAVFHSQVEIPIITFLIESLQINFQLRRFLVSFKQYWEGGHDDQLKCQNSFLLVLRIVLLQKKQVGATFGVVLCSDFTLLHHFAHQSQLWPHL